MHPFKFTSIMLAMAGIASAQTYELTLDSLDRGWINDTGYGNSLNTNYLAGAIGATEYRNYFMFDTSSIEGEVVSASLVVTNPAAGYSSPDANEIYAIHQVTGSIPQNSGAIDDVALFNDLGDGTIFGLGLVSSSTGELVISFDTFFLDAINNSGPIFSLGGTVETLNGSTSDNEIVFGYSGVPNGTSPSPVRLQLEILPPGASVPEPATGLLALIGLAGLLRRKRA